MKIYTADYIENYGGDYYKTDEADTEIAELVKFIDEWKEYLPEYEAEEKAQELINKHKKNPPVKEG